MEQKGAFLRGLPTEYDVAVESIMRAEDEFHEAVSRLMVRGPCIGQTEDNTESAVVMPNRNSEKKWFVPDKIGHVGKKDG